MPGHRLLRSSISIARPGGAGGPMRLFLSPSELCSYLPDRQSANLFIDPREPLDVERYSALVRAGFRRSGRYVYRPHCAGCDACRPARIPVALFTANRSQRRNLRANADLAVVRRDDDFRESHYALYLDYQGRRHPGSTMGDADRDAYRSFLTAEWASTEFAEFRLGDELLAVCVYDVLDDGLSAVYTFFSRVGERRAIGKYAILWLIAHARQLGLANVYVGYWIAECRKMAYKAEFRPLQIFSDGQWLESPGP